MTLKEALARCKQDKVTRCREAYGTDGNRWYRAFRNSRGNETLSELRRTLTGGVTEIRLPGPDPGPQVDWQPGSCGKVGPPREWPGPTLENGELAPVLETVRSWDHEDSLLKRHLPKGQA